MGKKMRYLKYAALLAICMFAAAAPSHAQRVFVGVGVGPAYYGPAPVCAYGYYGYYPYACAPYGYYGPDYFVSGVISITTAVSEGAKASSIVVSTVVASGAVIVASMAAKGSTEAPVTSTAVTMAVAEATAGDTGSFPEFLI